MAHHHASPVSLALEVLFMVGIVATLVWGFILELRMYRHYAKEGWNPDGKSPKEIHKMWRTYAGISGFLRQTEERKAIANALMDADLKGQWTGPVEKFFDLQEEAYREVMNINWSVLYTGRVGAKLALFGFGLAIAYLHLNGTGHLHELAPEPARRILAEYLTVAWVVTVGVGGYVAGVVAAVVLRLVLGASSILLGLGRWILALIPRKAPNAA